MSIAVLAMSELVTRALQEHGPQFQIARFSTQGGELESGRKSSIRAIAATGDAPINAELIASMPALEIVSLFGAGYDGIDLDALRTQKIVVSNTPDVVTGDVADLAMALWICVARRIIDADRYVRSGSWKKDAMALARTASGRPAGIIGLGRIGSAIARRCRASDMDVQYYSRTPRPDCGFRHWADLHAMAEAVDVLFVACPGGAETHHLVSESVIGQLGPAGTLINVSRGSVVDEAAMIRALLDGRLGGAGLDVFENEPAVPEAFIRHPGVVLTPHIGSATVETRKAMAQQMVDNLVRHFSGLPVSNRIA
jgi:lactate dehydrogenase-like 2-hydroxyacid dehydrogenase